MQFIVNLFGTVHATKDVGQQASGLYALDEKLRVLSNHVDFLLQQHFSQQSCQLKTYDEYTSDDDGQGEDREGGGQHATPAPSSIHEEDDGRAEEVDADVPAGNTEAGRDGPCEGQAGAGSGEAPAAESRPDAQNSH